MYIIDKNCLPNEIIDDDVRFDETTYLLYHQQQISAEELDDYFQKYHRKISAYEFIEKSHQIFQYFDNIEERSIKALNSSFLRYYLRDLKRKVSFKGMSQNTTKRLIAMFISEIIQEACFISFRNIYREKYMDVFEESVDKEHLHDEFDKMVLEIIKPILDKKNDDIDDNIYAKFYLYRHAHAQYLLELSEDDPNQELLKQIKKEVHEILSLSSDEAMKIVDKQNKEKEDQYKESDLALKEKLDDELNKLSVIKDGKKEQDDITKQLSDVSHIYPNHNILDDKKVQDFVQNTKNKDIYYDNQKGKQLLMRLKKTYQDYYLYDQDEFDHYYQQVFQKARVMLEVKQRFVCDFYTYIAILLLETDHLQSTDLKLRELEFHQKLDVAEEVTMDFINVLAYYLWHVQDGNQRKQRIEGFECIKNDVQDCYRLFLSLRADSTSEDYEDYDSQIFQFTPHDRYNNHIVLSVLLNLDNSTVLRRVKKLILSCYDNQYDLSQKCKELTRIYEDGINETNMHYTNDFADLFIMSYLKDKECLASYSPIIRHFHDLYIVYGIALGPYENIMSLCFDQKYDKDPQLMKKVIEVNQEFDNFVCSYHQHEVKNLKQFSEIESLLYNHHKSMHFYNELENMDVLFEKYREKFVWEWAISQDHHFFKKTLDEQVDEFLCKCFIYNLIDEIDSYEKNMPNKQQIEYQEYVNSLKKQIAEQKNIIQLKDKQLENMSVQKKTPKRNQNQDLLEKELKYYKQHVSTLNKEIASKNQEIVELKNNQQELYKLRELIFSMDQEVYEEKNTDVDLQSIIADKTIIVIGGHIALRNKMKQKYPNMKVLSRLSHITDAVLLNADHVFMFYKFMTHDMYNKAISVLTKNDIPWDYIPYTNLEKSEQMMYEILREKVE